MKVKEIIDYLEEVIPPDLAEPWDNVGFQCGDETAEVHKIVIALDPSEKAITYAINQQAQLLVTHHPLIFSPLKKITSSDPVAHLLMKMVKHHLNLMVLHTNLDSIADGVSAALLNQLGFKIQGVLQPKRLPGTGLGCWGMAKKTLAAEDFINLVKTKLDCSFVRVIGQSNQIKKVGVCGGSGADLIPLAIEQGIDAFVLGEVKYHPARLFEDMPILIVEIGHYESERFVLPILKKKIEHFLNKKGEKVELLIFEEASPYRIK
ncbi:MAG: Nif3-like dinuclear metal center hexameric protein [Candidatus Desulfofervidaceae bacterium]|nr:Nif3-like dinuclear metal center hexameric protein [Candidatus Desulfofervidaceae bacterium]